MINILKGRNLIHAAVGFPINQEKRDEINREIATKEIRILDINVIMTMAAQLKKDMQESGQGVVSEENEYSKYFVLRSGCVCGVGWQCWWNGCCEEIGLDLNYQKGVRTYFRYLVINRGCSGRQPGLFSLLFDIWARSRERRRSFGIRRLTEIASKFWQYEIIGFGWERFPEVYVPVRRRRNLSVIVIIAGLIPHERTLYNKL